MSRDLRFGLGYSFYSLLSVIILVLASYEANDPHVLAIAFGLLFRDFAIFTLAVITLLSVVTYLTVVSRHTDLFLTTWPIITAGYIWFATANLFSCFEPVSVSSTTGVAMALGYAAATILACARFLTRLLREPTKAWQAIASRSRVSPPLGMTIFVAVLGILYSTAACVFRLNPFVVLPSSRIAPMSEAAARLADSRATLTQIVASLGPPTSLSDDKVIYAACKNAGGIPWLNVGMKTECVNLVLHLSSEATLDRVDVEQQPVVDTVPYSAQSLGWCKQAIGRGDWQAAYRLLEGALVSADPQEWNKAHELIRHHPRLIAGALESFSLAKLHSSKVTYGDAAASLESDRLAVFRLVASKKDYEAALANLNAVFRDESAD
jgi:hypothetical protein